MDRKLIMIRLIGNLSGIGTIRIMKNMVTDEEKERILQAQIYLKKFKDQLVIFDNLRTLPDIRLKAKKLKVSRGLDILFLDYIQNLKGKENIYENMSSAAIDLYEMSGELSICTFVASQIPQDSAGWKSKESIDFKGAGEIAAVADVALWMKKIEGEVGGRHILMRKVRHGAPGKFDVKINFPGGKIVSMQEAVMGGVNDDVKSQL
jgi:replicative DNA helicase